MTASAWMFVFAALGFIDGCLVTWTIMCHRSPVLQPVRRVRAYANPWRPW